MEDLVAALGDVGLALLAKGVARAVTLKQGLVMLEVGTGGYKQLQRRAISDLLLGQVLFSSSLIISEQKTLSTS